MKKISYNNKMKNRSRTPRMFLVSRDGERIFEFNGVSIPHVCAVLKSNYTKNGKWSGTDYTLGIADDIVAFEYCVPFDGWGTSFDDIREGFTILNPFSDWREMEQVKNDIVTDEFIIRLRETSFKETGCLAKLIAKALENKKIMETL